MHALLGHVLLGEYDSDFLRAVVAVVEEDNDVAFLNGSQRFAVAHMYDRLHELVGNACVVGCLHCLVHILEGCALSVHQAVVGYLHTLPALVAVHHIETPLDRSNLAAGLLQVRRELVNKADTRLRVGIATVHEAVHKGASVQTVLLGNRGQVEEVLKGRVHTAVGSQAHDVQFLTRLFGSSEGAYYLGILFDRAVFAGTVNLHKVLIYHSAGTDIQVPHLRVAHLSVRQSYILAAGLQLTVRVFG